MTSSVQVTNISVDMTGYGTDPFTLWVTDAIGPGTTLADVLLQTALTFPNTGGGLNGAAIVSASTNLLFSPGSYFLVASSPQASIFQGWIVPGNPLPTSFGSVGQGSNSSPGSGTDATFPPDSTFLPLAAIIGSDFAFQISGNVNNVPEPLTTPFVIGGLVLVKILGKLQAPLVNPVGSPRNLYPRTACNGALRVHRGGSRWRKPPPRRSNCSSAPPAHRSLRGRNARRARAREPPVRTPPAIPSARNRCA